MESNDFASLSYLLGGLVLKSLKKDKEMDELWTTLNKKKVIGSKNGFAYVCEEKRVTLILAFRSMQIDDFASLSHLICRFVLKSLKEPRKWKKSLPFLKKKRLVEMAGNWLKGEN